MNYTERRKEQAQKTETAILTAALSLMREYGFDSVTVRDICQKAGITTGAFYHHFQSKEDLFDKGFAPLDLYMERALEEQLTNRPADKLRVILTNYALFIENCGELVARYYQRRIGNPDVLSLDASRFVKRALVDCFKQAMDQGMKIFHDDPEWSAEFCYCHFRGILIDWLLHKRDYSLMDRMMESYELFKLMF